MALLDAYASVEEYRDRNNLTAVVDDAEITELLLLNSRRAEKMLHLQAGYFNTHSGTYLFSGTGEKVLDLVDDDGMHYCLRTITADSLGIDLEADATYDYYTWDLADNWVQGRPYNASALSEPFTSLEIIPTTTAPITIWPKGRRNIRIVGTFGWAAVPTSIREFVIALTRDMRDTHMAGATRFLTGPGGEEIAVQEDTFWRWKALADLYGRRTVAFA